MGVYYCGMKTFCFAHEIFMMRSKDRSQLCQLGLFTFREIFIDWLYNYKVLELESSIFIVRWERIFSFHFRNCRELRIYAYVNEAPAELLFVTEKMSVLLRKNIIDFNIWKDMNSSSL
jgi:hypothetical protein